MIASKDFENAVELIEKSAKALIVTHTRPDGDGCGSVVALEETLTAMGKEAKSVFLSDIPDWYMFLFDKGPLLLERDVTLEDLKQAEFDLVIIADTNSYTQLPRFEEYLRQNEVPVLVLDHHVTSDGLGSVELIDTSAAATGLIVHDLLEFAGWAMNEKIARALFVAAATDTGWFQFQNTDSRVYRTCADLIEAGADPTQIYHDLYQNFSFERFKLMVAITNSVELHFDGRFATHQLYRADFERTGAAYGDTENLIDECRKIASVEAAAMFIESDDNKIRCSLRSTGRVDVRRIAQKFGGGGHTAAAGTYIEGTLENAKALIFEQVKTQFAQIDASDNT